MVSTNLLEDGTGRNAQGAASRAHHPGIENECAQWRFSLHLTQSQHYRSLNPADAVAHHSFKP